MRNCFLWMSKESDKIFLEMKSTSGEDTVNSVEMTTKDLKYDINLDDKAVAKLGEIDSNFESCAVGKCYQKSFHATEKLFGVGRINQYSKLHFLTIRNYSHPNSQQPPS